MKHDRYSYCGSEFGPSVSTLRRYDLWPIAKQHLIPYPNRMGKDPVDWLIPKSNKGINISFIYLLISINICRLINLSIYSHLLVYRLANWRIITQLLG